MSGTHRATKTSRQKSRSIALTFISVLMLLALIVSIRGASANRIGPVAPIHASPTTTTRPTTVTTSTNPFPGPPVAGSWHVAFDQTFSSTSLDASVWSTCFPRFPSDGCTNFGNNELEWYTPSQVQVSDGVLHLVAQREATPGLTKLGQQTSYSWRSGLVTTAASFPFTYGYVQVRAKFPTAMGMWPALWLLPANGSWPPEIDMIEANPMRDGKQLHMYVLHRDLSDPPAQRDQVLTSASSDGWNTYAILWTPNEIIWYVNGVEKFHATGGVPNQPMYLLANLAIAGVAGYTPDASTPALDTMDIQHVEVWQQ
jgi:beta-glucanase (GH16 family)